MDSRVSFLRVGGWTSHQDSMPGCAETVVNTMVFIRFPVLRMLEVWVPRGRVRVSFGSLGGFLVTLGSLFLVFEGPGKRLEFRRIFKDSLGSPRSRDTPSGW